LPSIGGHGERSGVAAGKTMTFRALLRGADAREGEKTAKEAREGKELQLPAAERCATTPTTPFVSANFL